MAAGWNHESTVSLLLSRGADHTLQKHDGETALDWARLNDNTGVVRILEVHASKNNDRNTKTVSEIRPVNVNVNVNKLKFHSLIFSLFLLTFNFLFLYQRFQESTKPIKKLSESIDDWVLRVSNNKYSQEKIAQLISVLKNEDIHTFTDLCDNKSSLTKDFLVSRGVSLGFANTIAAEILTL